LLRVYENYYIYLKQLNAIFVEMQPLNLPTYSFTIKAEGERKLIFDNIRKKYVVLTPEEWVRQHFIRFLTEEMHYPASLISVELFLKLNNTSRRSDVVVFDKNGKPLMIIECKAPAVPLSQATFDQVARYNLKMKVSYLLITNGLQHYCCRLDNQAGTYEFLDHVPGYNELLAGS